MSKSLNNLQPWGAFFLRLVLGFAMVYHGYAKVIPGGGLHGNLSSALQHHSHYVASLAVPYWFGYISALAEFVGGILILLGLLTRFAAFLIACDMLGVLLLVTRHHGYAVSEYPLALLVIAIMLFFYGAGVFALDRRFGLS
ncbi:MAG: DoxX family protein [Edaphobacter sp.]